MKGKIALVTGASRGIGAAIAQRLSLEGARVIGTATTADGAARIGEQLRPQGGRGVVLDVSNQESIDAVIADIEACEGTVGILCNNAGITRDTLLLRMKQEDWDEVLQTNLASVFRLSKAVLRGMMKAREGRIINITSVVALTGNPGQVNYAAAKAGMVGMSKALAAEVASRNITVNVVSPGFIETAMTGALSDSIKLRLLELIPTKRMGRPEEVASAVVYLASEEASYVTGQTLHINGGMAMI